MKTSTWVTWAVIAIVVLLGGWYWLSSTQTPETPSPSVTQTETQTAPTEANTQTTVTGNTTKTTVTTTSATSVLSVHSDVKLGAYLAAANGKTLYSYASDVAGSGKSTCTNTCATTWPPYTIVAGSSLPVGAGVTGVIATIKRADGTIQVTYNGMPLYFLVRDTTANVVTGNNTNGFRIVKP